jgi:fructokinase
LGGAPFNVAWHLQAFGQAPVFLSRVGDDAEGEQVRAAMRAWGMDTRGLQTDPERATGRVQVEIIDGEPHYNILENCAWDAIEPISVSSCELLYHGSLAMRTMRSAETLQLLRDMRPREIFIDVNLRAPWWQRERLSGALASADCVKLNSDELAALNPVVSADPVQGFLGAYDLKTVVVTRGSEGAEVCSAQGERLKVKPLEQISVVDTVGAGDAFTSVFLLGSVLGWPLDVTLRRALDFASRVVGQRGAIVQDPGFYAEFISAWNLAA